MAVISADSHIEEPAELFGEWLPERFRHLVPRTETRADGARYRIVEGRKPRRLDLAEARETDDDQHREFRNDPSGGRDIARRLLDQQRDGVVGEVLYPNTSLSLFHAADPAYQNAVARLYNDWLIDHFRQHLDRFVPVGIVPVADLDAGVAEAERLATLGYRALKVPITMPGRPYNDPAYEPLWSVCEEAGLVVSFHAFSNAEDRYPQDWGEAEGFGGALDMMAMCMADGMRPVSQLISSGALMRHPQLRFVVVECGAGWLAWLLHVLDEQNDKKHMWIRPRLELKPSEYFARQGHVTFSDDAPAMANLPLTGSAGLMWGSDYPHDEGTFPHSRAVIARTFAGLDERDVSNMTYANAARLYGLAAADHA